MTASRPQGPFQAYRAIWGAMLGGAVLFWIVASLLVELGLATVPAPGLASPEAALLIGAALGLVACAAGLVVRSKAAGAAAYARPMEGLPETPTRMAGLLLYGWGIVLALGLLSGTLVIVLGEPWVLGTAAPLCALAMALAAPRQRWFAP